MKQKHFFLPLLFLLIVSCNKSDTGTTPTGLPAPPASLGLNSFYKKYTDAGGIPVISSAAVDDQALLKAKEIILYMVSTIPAEKAKMIENKLRVGILGINERPTQLPEYSDLYTAFPGTDWDNRARAYGATLQRPLTSNCEENMLCRQDIDRYKGEEILTHEFAHAIHELGIRFTTPGFDAELQAAFNNAVTNNLWANTYSRTDLREYWAEGVQSYFNCNVEVPSANGVHNEINTRTELQNYDPILFNLIKRYFSAESRKHGCY